MFKKNAKKSWNTAWNYLQRNFEIFRKNCFEVLKFVEVWNIFEVVSEVEKLRTREMCEILGWSDLGHLKRIYILLILIIYNPANDILSLGPWIPNVSSFVILNGAKRKICSDRCSSSLWEYSPIILIYY